MTLPGKVLDAYAVMAFLEGETGSEYVRSLLLQAVRGEIQLAITSVNLGEVYYSISRTNSPQVAERIVDELVGIQLDVVAVDWELAKGAAEIKAATPVAYADCFAATLANLRGWVVVTGDAEFRRLEGRVNIDWI